MFGSNIAQQHFSKAKNQIIPGLNIQMKSYNQIFQEHMTQVETCLMWTTCKWIVIHIDYWPHLLGSLRMCALSLLPDTAAERITAAIVYGKLNSRVCVRAF